MAILYFHYNKNVDLEKLEVQTKIESLKDFFSYYYGKRDFIKLNQLLLTAKTANTDKLEIVSLDSNAPISFINLPTSTKNSDSLFCNSRLIQYYGADLCKVNYCIDKNKIFNSTVKADALILTIVFFILAISLALILLPFYLFNRFILDTIHKINEIRLNNPTADAFLDFSKKIKIPILEKLVVEIYNLFTEKELLNKQIIESEKKEIIVQMASQVSHDIRSPLMSLNMSVRSWLHLLPEDERIAVRSQIQRIQDIANGLLSKKKEMQKSEASSSDKSNNDKLTSQLLSTCIEEIVTEKRLQYRSFLDLYIEADLDNTYGIFANINLIEMKRILSNLINNATEAYDDKKGMIKIQLMEDTTSAQIIVEDFGKGIPTEILNKLGQAGVSFGKGNNKESGAGLGVYHAKTTTESWGGSFSIESEVGKGTKITLTIPKAKPPHWFVSKISLSEYSAIMILDDDQGIHQTWDKRFADLKLSDHHISVFHSSTPDDFSNWVKNNSSKFHKVLYLCDYELIGQNKNGLQLIEENNLKTAAYLVTSRYEEEKIRLKCKELGVKLIPKMIAGLVPIELIKIETTAAANDSLGNKIDVSNNVTDSESFNIVYIEDEPYPRRAWERSAKKAGIKLLILASPHEFEKYESVLSKETCEIYIDRELGDESPKGEVFAKTLHEKGFKKLFLATGHESEMFEHLSSWLKCTGKMPPWENEDDW
ncbi:MAG: HAMP domain-containing histidine kinase [Oligoflexia bacterium]|nr:HAMP domain-containing histidine kinase [Oligoflexia bacterium]